MATKKNVLTGTIVKIIIADAKRGIVHLITRDSTGRRGMATRIKGETTFRKSRMTIAAINAQVGFAAI
jgi:hypothetical protein